MIGITNARTVLKPKSSGVIETISDETQFIAFIKKENLTKRVKFTGESATYRKGIYRIENANPFRVGDKLQDFPTIYFDTTAAPKSTDINNPDDYVFHVTNDSQMSDGLWIFYTDKSLEDLGVPIGIVIFFGGAFAFFWSEKDFTINITDPPLNIIKGWNMPSWEQAYIDINPNAPDSVIDFVDENQFDTWGRYIFKTENVECVATLLAE